MTESLSNHDLDPVPVDKRTWSKWNIAALWVGMAVCIPTYMLAASMISAGMRWWQALLTVMLGNLIVLIPMILNAHGGTKYGIPFPVLARASFGTTGAHIPSVARALVACGWFGIQTWIGGAAIYSIISVLGWITEDAEAARIGVIGISPWQFVCFGIFWLVHLAIVARGINSIKWLEAWAAPFLLLAGLSLLLWAILKVDNPGQLLKNESGFTSNREFWKVFFPSLTAMVGFWATLSLNIPDFSRYCKSQRDQAVGQLIGLPTTMTLFCFIGIVVTGATISIFGEAVADPVDLVSRLGSKTVVVVSLFAVLLATLSTNLAANVVSPANGFANIAPSRISFRTGAIATCVIGVLIMPWRLYNDLGDYIFTWLIGYSALLGPIAGIIIADYFILRRTRLDVAQFYDADGKFAGINKLAVMTLVLSVLPNIPGFVNAATNSAGTPKAIFPSVFDAMYDYAWFIGIALSIVIYTVSMRNRAKPYEPDEETR